jgi:hypothetical protein
LGSDFQEWRDRPRVLCIPGLNEAAAQGSWERGPGRMRKVSLAVSVCAGRVGCCECEERGEAAKAVLRSGSDGRARVPEPSGHERDPGRRTSRAERVRGGWASGWTGRERRRRMISGRSGGNGDAAAPGLWWAPRAEPEEGLTAVGTTQRGGLGRWRQRCQRLCGGLGLRGGRLPGGLLGGRE